MKNTFLNDLLGDGLCHIEKVSHDDPLYVSGKMIETTFTELVDRLRNPQIVKCPPINDLMTLLWRLVGNNICPASIMPVIPSLSFWGEIRGSGGVETWFATIICPGKWMEMLKEDIYMQLGAMVFNASKARDYWNRKLPGYNATEKDILERSYTYETEFLNYLKREDPAFTPNKYQSQVLEKFPQGLASARPGLHYEGRPFPTRREEILLAGPPYPVDTRSAG